jgi:beta-1,4-mannooligosaccharide/beta-1,4-mannosyl-N-acetylglucosamine phosphorylase
MVLFPEKVGGRYVRLERPVDTSGANVLRDENAMMWLSYSPDLRYWGDSQHLLSSPQVSWANSKIGPAAPPIKTERGWLTTFHAVWRDNDHPYTNGWEETWPKTYRAGLMLLDLDDPSRIIGRSARPLLSPTTWYETGEGAPCENWGFRTNVIFPGGMLLEDDGEVKLYYGASDTVECLATGHVDDLVKACLNG